MARKIFRRIVILIFLWNLIEAQKESDGIVSFQTSDPIAEIQHLVVSQGQIYAGATNHLFQLDSSLNLIADVETGPKLDNPMCNAKGDCLQSKLALIIPGAANSTKIETPNFNKILIPFLDYKLLIACGTLLQGICELHRLDDIRKTIPNDDLVPVAANMHNASTVGFIGPGPEAKPVLYVGATHTYHWYRDHFPAVAMRKLEEGNMFNLEVPVDIEGQSAMLLRSDIRDENLIRYVGGFVHDGFAYWALVQKKDHADRNSRYITKLGRVCTKHSRFESYSEIPLSCTGGDMTRYDLLQAIFVGRMGAKVRSNLPSEYHAENHPEMEFLVGVFARGDDPAKPQPQSAVCIYPLKQIRAAFQVNIERCNQGAGTKNLPWFAGVAPVCTKQYETIPEDSCIAMRVSGLLDETATPVLTYDNQLLTAVTMTVTPQEDTVLFFGTSDGRLKKVKPLNSILSI